MPQIGPFGLQWQNWSGSGTDLVAPVAMDFSTPNTSYSILPQGNFSQLGNVFAQGVVIDNLTNSKSLAVVVGPLTETVPPYSKTLITLPAQGSQLTATATDGQAILLFFRGEFHGSTTATNFYSAQQQANLSTLTSGTLDAWLNSIKLNESVGLVAGTDLNLLSVTGFYDVATPLNGPTGTGALIWHIEQQTYSVGTTFARQTARSLDVAGFIFERWLISAAWSAWIQIPSTTYNNPDNTQRVLEYQDMAGVSSLVVDVSGWAMVDVRGTLIHATAGANGVLQVSNNGGISWGTGTDYLWAGVIAGHNNVTFASSGSSGQPSFPLAGNADAATKQSFDMRFHFPTTGQNMSMFGTRQWVAGGVAFMHHSTGYRSAAANVDHIRINAPSGAFTSGQVQVIGVV